MSCCFVVYVALNSRGIALGFLVFVLVADMSLDIFRFSRTMYYVALLMLLGNAYHLYSTRWAGARLMLRDIRYTQNFIKPWFSDTRHLLEDLIRDVKVGRVSPDTFPPIRVGWYNGAWHSLDNRRLYVLKQACCPTLEVKVHMVWPIDSHEHHDPRCFGESVEVVEVTTGNMRFLGRGRFAWFPADGKIVGRVVERLT